ncbi:hypothetical protein [Sphingorhabdus sp.]
MSITDVNHRFDKRHLPVDEWQKGKACQNVGKFYSAAKVNAAITN